MTRSDASSQHLSSPKRPRSTESDAQDRRAPQHFPPNNLPNPLTSFVGRHAEVEAVSSLIRDESVRLLTLTGPGGVGKTRLAFRVVETLLPDFEDGAYFVALASLSDPQLVVPTIAQTLDIKEDGATPLAERLGDHLRDKGMLLLLDNFEQVVEAAPQVTALLQGAPGVQVIITSRVSLHLYGEHEYPVPPMLLPDDGNVLHTTVEQLAEYEAIQLFVERAQLVHPDFSLTPDNARSIAQICARLDGLPLALELAAARTRLLSPQALLARLDKSLPLLTGGPRDLPDRQKTLRGAIDWSYDLLDVTEQQLFACLSVFVGGCTLDAAAHITQHSAEDEGRSSVQHSVMNRLESLVDKNLLRLREEPDGEPRFWMLATIREYALEKLAESGEMSDVQEAHARFFLGMTERFAEELRGPKQADWLALLTREHDNLRSALSWITDGEAAVNLAGALWWFWYVRGHVSEGRRWLDKALSLAGADSPQFSEIMRHKLADAYNGAGALAGTQGDYAQATAMLKESLKVTRSLGNKRGAARSLNNLGIFTSHQGAYAEAEVYFRESFDLKKEIGDEVGLSSAYNRLAEIAHIKGDYGQAEELYKLSLAMRRAHGDKAWIVDTLQNLAALAYDRGDLERAIQMAGESREMAQEMGYKEGLAIVSSSMAIVLFGRGQHEKAEKLLEESLDLFRTLGDQSGQSLTLKRLAQVASARQDYTTARTLLVQALQIRLSLHEYNTEMADTLEWLAYLDASEAATSDAPEKAERSAMILGAIEARRKAMSAPIAPINRAHHDQMVQMLRSRLGSAGFDAAWRKGRAMSFEEVAALALRESQASSQDQEALPDPGLTPQSSVRAASSFDLTERELGVLRLVAEGLTNKEIAERLTLSYRTVQNHLYSIFSKLDVTTRSAATRYAIERSLV